jgi:predicted hotdog family 3-hydroxylacyl-ACP dehydratase
MFEKEELLSIVPHRGRMLLLSRVIGYNLKERSIEAEYHVTEDCLFYDFTEMGVPAWVGFEFIAQAISAFSGIRDKEKGELPKRGFVLSVSKLQIGLPFFKTGSIITIRAKEIENMYPVYVFEGEIFLDDKKVLAGKLTVMEVDNENQIRLIA